MPASSAIRMCFSPLLSIAVISRSMTSIAQRRYPPAASTCCTDGFVLSHTSTELGAKRNKELISCCIRHECYFESEMEPAGLSRFGATSPAISCRDDTLRPPPHLLNRSLPDHRL